MKPQMHLAIDVSWTQVETTWREPGARVNRHYPDVGLFEDIARVAERGLIDLIFFGDSHRHSQHLEGLDRRCGALRRRVAAAGHEPVDHGDVAGDEARRLRPDLRDDLHAPVLRRASAQLARPHHQRPHRLQCHHLAAQGRRAELRLRRIDGARPALRSHGRVHGRLPGAVEERRARRLRMGSRDRPRRQPGQGAGDQSRRADSSR